MALAYTPGLKVKTQTVIRKERRLPIKGEVLLSVDDKTNFDTVVARTKVPGDVQVINASRTLGIDADEVEELTQYMLKKEGDKVKKDDLIAQRISFFGLSKAFVNATADGVIENVSDITGQVTIREDPIPVEVDAYVPGRVVRVLPEEGVVVETQGALVQGIFGIGGETHGKIRMAVEAPDALLTEDMINESDAGNVLVAGSLVTGEALRKANTLGVKGIVAGGVQDKDLKDFLGYEIGVAITGHEEVATTLVVTEGFGKMGMSQRTFELLRDCEGKEAALNGATQIRAGVIRPEIIVPSEETPSTKTEETSSIFSSGMQPGMTVRVIADPYFGQVGTIASLPVPLQKVQSESSVRIIEVQLDDGRSVVVPRANVEIIET